MQHTSTQGPSFRLGDLPPRHVPPIVAIAVFVTMTVPTAFALGFGGIAFGITHLYTDPLAHFGPGANASFANATVDSYEHRENKGKHSGDYVFMTVNVDDEFVEIVRYMPGIGAHHLSRAVQVRVDPAHPSRAEAPGMHVAEAPVFFVFGLPLAIALASFVFCVVRARRRLWLLEHGKLTRARRINYQVRRGSKNKQTHVVTFEFEADGVTREHEVKTSSYPTSLMDQDEELLLFDPERPTRAFLLDELSIAPRHDSAGTVGATNMMPFVFSTIGWCVALVLFVGGFVYPYVQNAR